MPAPPSAGRSAAPSARNIGAAIGTFAGARIDAALIGAPTVKRTGPRLSDVNIQASTEGAAIPALFGRARVAGQLDLGDALQGNGRSKPKRPSAAARARPTHTVVNKDYVYSISFAVGLCEGEVHKLGRVWADGKLYDLVQVTARFYPGTEDQAADPLIEADRGRGQHARLSRPLLRRVRGHAARRIRQPHSPAAVRADPLDHRRQSDVAGEPLARAVTLIPAAGEFVYADEAVTADDGLGGTTPENVHGADGQVDMLASLDELGALAPNLGAVALVVGWFGDDLRCGDIAIKPGVEDAQPRTPIR